MTTNTAADDKLAPTTVTTTASTTNSNLYDYREVWLKIWNNSTDPKQVSCVTAFDILYYCYSPANQLRSIYRTGQPSDCRRQKEDIMLCANIKYLNKMTSEEASEALRASRDHFVIDAPHVWEWRDEPPEQFRRNVKTTALRYDAASAATDDSAMLVQAAATSVNSTTSLPTPSTPSAPQPQPQKPQPTSQSSWFHRLRSSLFQPAAASAPASIDDKSLQ